MLARNERTRFMPQRHRPRNIFPALRENKVPVARRVFHRDARDRLPRARYKPAPMSRLLSIFTPLLLLASAAAEQPKVVAGSRRDEPFVELARLTPPIAVELRYATARNLVKRPIYPSGARCLVRASVAERLVVAQAWLRRNADAGTQLKIWDGYRPAWAHRILWSRLPNKEYLRDPKLGGSLHTWGVCADATLCDARGRELRMPSNFDEFTPAARTHYDGRDKDVRRHLRWLQQAMSAGGFLVVQDEWWHFVARDFEAFGPGDIPLAAPRKR